VNPFSGFLLLLLQLPILLGLYWVFARGGFRS
jgi:membrane protein insertase Oxa1/YidC/SpoIIIJ